MYVTHNVSVVSGRMNFADASHFCHRCKCYFWEDMVKKIRGNVAHRVLMQPRVH